MVGRPGDQPDRRPAGRPERPAHQPLEDPRHPAQRRSAAPPDGLPAYGAPGRTVLPTVPRRRPPLTTPRREWTPRRVQNLLLTIGALLLVIATAIFTAVSWHRLGDGPQSLILTGAAAGAATLTRFLSRRALTATAEAISAICIGLLAFDADAAHQVVLPRPHRPAVLGRGHCRSGARLRRARPLHPHSDRLDRRGRRLATSLAGAGFWRRPADRRPRPSARPRRPARRGRARRTAPHRSRRPYRLRRPRSAGSPAGRSRGPAGSPFRSPTSCTGSGGASLSVVLGGLAASGCAAAITAWTVGDAQLPYRVPARAPARRRQCPDPDLRPDVCPCSPTSTSCGGRPPSSPPDWSSWRPPPGCPSAFAAVRSGPPSPPPPSPCRPSCSSVSSTVAGQIGLVRAAVAGRHRNPRGTAAEAATVEQQFGGAGNLVALVVAAVMALAVGWLLRRPDHRPGLRCYAARCGHRRRRAAARRFVRDRAGPRRRRHHDRRRRRGPAAAAGRGPPSPVPPLLSPSAQARSPLAGRWRCRSRPPSSAAGWSPSWSPPPPSPSPGARSGSPAQRSPLATRPRPSLTSSAPSTSPWGSSSPAWRLPWPCCSSGSRPRRGSPTCSTCVAEPSSSPRFALAGADGGWLSWTLLVAAAWGAVVCVRADRRLGTPVAICAAMLALAVLPPAQHFPVPAVLAWWTTLVALAVAAAWAAVLLGGPALAAAPGQCRLPRPRVRPGGLLHDCPCPRRADWPDRVPRRPARRLCGGCGRADRPVRRPGDPAGWREAATALATALLLAVSASAGHDGQLSRGTRGIVVAIVAGTVAVGAGQAGQSPPRGRARRRADLRIRHAGGAARGQP